MTYLPLIFNVYEPNDDIDVSYCLEGLVFQGMPHPSTPGKVVTGTVAVYFRAKFYYPGTTGYHDYSIRPVMKAWVSKSGLKRGGTNPYDGCLSWEPEVFFRVVW